MHWMMNKPFQSGWSWASFLKYVLYDFIVYFLVTVFIRRTYMWVSVCLFLHPVNFSRKDNAYIILIGIYASPLGSWEQSRGEGAGFNRQTFSINPLFPILGSFTTPSSGLHPAPMTDVWCPWIWSLRDNTSQRVNITSSTGQRTSNYLTPGAATGNSLLITHASLSCLESDQPHTFLQRQQVH